MSTAPLPPKTTPPPGPGKFKAFLAYIFLPHAKPGEIVIVSHSGLFYWWPVWAVGFLMAVITWFANTFLVIVPARTRAVKAEQTRVDILNNEGKVDRTVKGEKTRVEVTNNRGEVEKRKLVGYIVPNDKSLLLGKNPEGEPVDLQPELRMARGKSIGVVFVVVLLLVIFITNVPLRGLWSVFIIVVILMTSIIFALAGIWERLIFQSRLLAIHINLGGYLFTSLVLFIIWIINFYFFDRQFYMIFTPGQVRVHLEIGAGETVYDTGGMVFQKQRSDLFRHWILGFGSGDLIVRPSGGVAHIDLPNVLNVGRKVKIIEKKLAEKEVVAA
jgi:hypothetical protein